MKKIYLFIILFLLVIPFKFVNAGVVRDGYLKVYLKVDATNQKGNHINDAKYHITSSMRPFVGNSILEEFGSNPEYKFDADLDIVSDNTYSLIFDIIGFNLDYFDFIDDMIDDGVVEESKFFNGEYDLDYLKEISVPYVKNVIEEQFYYDNYFIDAFNNVSTFKAISVPKGFVLDSSEQYLAIIIDRVDIDIIKSVSDTEFRSSGSTIPVYGAMLRSPVDISTVYIYCHVEPTPIVAEEHNVSVKSDHGIVDTVKTNLVGDTVEFLVTPDKEYTIKEIRVTTIDGNPVLVTNNKFVMPASDVVIDVVYEKINPETGNIQQYITACCLMFIIGGIVILEITYRNRKFIK